jgi:hypothetical protein
MRRGVAFDQGDGLGDDVAVAGQHAGHVFVDGEALAAWDGLARHGYAGLAGDAIMTAVNASHDRGSEFGAGVGGNPVGFIVFVAHGQDRHALGWGDKDEVSF